MTHYCVVFKLAILIFNILQGTFEKYLLEFHEKIQPTVYNQLFG